MRVWERKKNKVGVPSAFISFMFPIPMKKYPDTYPNYGMCGGTLVSTQHVITAAHCLYIQDPNDHQMITGKYTRDDLAVRVGDHNIYKEGEEFLKPKFINVAFIREHEGWIQAVPGKMGEQQRGFDIAILRLVSPVDINVYTPACLAKRSEGGDTFKNQDGIAVGWGATMDWPYNDFPSVPNEVTLKIAPMGSREKCQAKSTFCK